MAKAYTSRPPGTRSVRLDLDAERHARLRVMAAAAGLPMSQFVRSIVEAHMDRDGDGVEKKETRREKILRALLTP